MSQERKDLKGSPVSPEEKERIEYLRLLDRIQGRMVKSVEDGEARLAVVSAQIIALQEEQKRIIRARTHSHNELGGIVTHRERFNRGEEKMDAELINRESMLWAANAIAQGRIKMDEISTVTRRTIGMIIGARLNEECLNLMAPMDRNTFCHLVDGWTKTFDVGRAKRLLLEAHDLGYVKLVERRSEEVSGLIRVEDKVEKKEKIPLAKLWDILSHELEGAKEKVPEKVLDQAIIAPPEAEIRDAERDRVFENPQIFFDEVSEKDEVYFQIEGKGKKDVFEGFTVESKEAGRLILKYSLDGLKYVYRRPGTVVKNEQGTVVFLAVLQEASASPGESVPKKQDGGLSRRFFVSRFGIKQRFSEPSMATDARSSS